MDTLSFILRFFREGRFDGKKAYAKLYGRPRRFYFVPGIAAAAAIALGVFLFTARQNSQMRYYAYDVSQSFTLKDGTEVTLSPGSSLSLKPHRNPRAVNMTGTIRFSVAKDPEHPFTVQTKNAFVEVLGTVFTVSDSPARVDVEEGRVSFSLSENAPGVILTAGESARVKNGKAVKELVFEDAPLEEVLKALSERFGVQLSSASRGKRLSAEFTDESLEEIILLIEDALDVQIVVK